jgi:hypothetical protein
VCPTNTNEFLISKTDSRRIGRALTALQSVFRDVLVLDGCWLAVTAPGAGLIEKLAGLYGLIAGEGFAIDASKLDYFNRQALPYGIACRR